MNDFPGNPHATEAAKHRPQLVDEETANESYTAEEGITDETMQFSALNRLAEATLAVAYEQRTATLVQIQKMAIDTLNATDDPPAEFINSMNELTKIINERIGTDEMKAAN